MNNPAQGSFPFQDDLYPFTWTRPVTGIRLGVLTLAEKWIRLLPGGKPAGLPENIVPDEKLAALIRARAIQGRSAGAVGMPISSDGGMDGEGRKGKPEEGTGRGAPISTDGGGHAGERKVAGVGELMSSDTGIRGARDPIEGKRMPGANMDALVIPDEAIPEILSAARLLRYPWEIFQLNEQALHADFDLLTRGRISQPLPPSVQAVNAGRIFIEEGAVLEHVILNASAGPIYIGRNALIMDGAIIRGPFAACEGAIVKMGAKIYGATTLGPFCVAGGEIKNSVLFGYSNKAHDGYLGDSVLGEWCNLGAGCTNSNLKNNAGMVKVWHQAGKSLVAAGMKCGLLMGDYSRAAINTSFNTGTVVGVACNVFGEGLTPTHIPSFSWGDGKYRLKDALEHIANWKKLKNQELRDDEIQVLRHIFDKL